MTLDKNIKKQLLQDYKAVHDCIYQVLESGRNGFVADPDYLDPTTDGNCPLNDEDGEFKYFSKIRESLEIVLLEGKIDKDLIPPRAPEYWRT